MLFLDEPTTGLDPQARRNFWELVESIKARRKTIILTTHYMEEAELLCDEIAIMDRGRIVAQGPPRQLLQRALRRSAARAAAPGLHRRGTRPAAQASSRRAERVEISTHDLEGTLRALLEARVPLAQLAHPARQSRGSVPRAHRHGAAGMMRRLLLGTARPQPRVPARPRHAAVHAPAADGPGGRHGLRVRRSRSGRSSRSA